MNLADKDWLFESEVVTPAAKAAYKLGHRDSRHAAAEIAAEADSEIENMIGCAEASGFDSLSEAIAIAGKAEEFRAAVKRELEGLRKEVVRRLDDIKAAPPSRMTDTQIGDWNAAIYTAFCAVVLPIDATIAKLFGEDAIESY